MKQKTTNNFCRAASLALVLSILFSMFSVLNVSAETNDGYYTTVASLDYEKANPLTTKTDGVSITTLNNGSFGYINANPKTLQGMNIAPVSGLESGKKYTYKIDLYVLEYSSTSDKTLAAFILQSENDITHFSDYVYEQNYNLNQWHTYEKDFICSSEFDAQALIYAYENANIIFDNLRILDENGNTVFSEDFETKKYTLPEGFKYVNDYTSGTGDAYDKALHLTNTCLNKETSAVQTGTIGSDNSIGEDGVSNEYTVTFDYMILKKRTTILGTFDFAFAVQNRCSECNGGELHAPKGTSQWYYGEYCSTNIWYTAKETITIENNCENFFTCVSLYAGAEILINNIKITDANGNVVMCYDMDEPFPGSVLEDSFAGEAEVILLNQLIWCKGIPNVVDGHLYVDASKLLSEFKYVDIKFDASEDILPPTNPYITFDYRIDDKTTCNAGKVMTAFSFNGSFLNNNISSQNLPSDYVVGKWVNSGKIFYNNVSLIADSENFIRLFVYSGVEIEIDNIKIFQENGTEIANLNFATDGIFEESSDTTIITETEEVLEKDYAIYTDNSANTGISGRIWFNSLGMSQLALAANKTYTIKFDVYSETSGNYDFVYWGITNVGGNTTTSAEWHKISVTAGKWEKYSITTTPTASIAYHSIFAGAGFKGYFDNFEVFDGDTQVSLFSMNEKSLGKTSSGAKVVELSEDLVNAKSINHSLLVNTTSMKNSSAKPFWFNALGMSSFSGNLVNGQSYTLCFDLYPIVLPSKYVFNYGTYGTAESYSDKYLKANLFDLNKWNTVNIPFVAANTPAYHILNVYGGFKGYIDNFHILDSDGNVVSGTTADFSKLNIPTTYESYLSISTESFVDGDNYTIRYITDKVGMVTYGSNGVLKIVNNNADQSYLLFNSLETGAKYRISMNYNVVSHSKESRFDFAVLNVNSNNEFGHAFIKSDVLNTFNIIEYEFVANGDVSFLVYNGCEVVFDNILLEKFTASTSTQTAPVELKAKKYEDGASTYIDVTVDTSISKTDFNFDLSYDGQRLEYVNSSSKNANISITKKDNSLSVDVESSQYISKNLKSITGEIAVLTFKVIDGIMEEADVTFEVNNFEGITSEVLPVTVRLNTLVVSLGALKEDANNLPSTIVFGMRLSVDDKGNENINGEIISEKGFIATIGYHLDAELQLDSYNPYVKKYVVTSVKESGARYNIYSLKITNPEPDYPIAVRPYAITESGVYYGFAMSASANDLANVPQNTWTECETVTSTAMLSISKTAAQTWQGANAVSLGFIYTNGYTDEQINTELDRMEDMNINMVRSYYDQSFSAEYDAENNCITYNWDTPEMQGLVRWLKAMEERNIEVALNMGWGIDDVLYRHCTTYSYDDCVSGFEHDAQNPFWSIQQNGIRKNVIKAYGDWVAASMKYLVEDCGITNVKYLIMLTEPVSNDGDWSKYQALVKSAHDALNEIGMRERFKFVGPNVCFTHSTSKNYMVEIDNVLNAIKDYIDIYSFHIYPPLWPHGMEEHDETKDNYELYVKYLNTFISEVNKHDSGADFWIDEWDYSGLFFERPYYATQLAQTVTAALNTGVENIMLWQLFEIKWPDREDNEGSFEDGVLYNGLAPSLTVSDVPYNSYYGYSLLIKYMGDIGATVYPGSGNNGVYTAMIENTDGTQSILVVNTNKICKPVNISIGRDINGTLLRHMYNPATVKPSSDAVIIAADKAFDDVSEGLIDIIPAGAVVVYTTDISYYFN